LLFVSTAVINRIIKHIVHNDAWYLPKNPEFEYGCLIKIRGSIMYFTIPEDYHLIQHPTITKACGGLKYKIPTLHKYLLFFLSVARGAFPPFFDDQSEPCI
jgi:hypothetical protein